ncbi:hypothetical protein HYX08_01500 [Candidatus Woesearchaeota archaeon]|nr:hypothetical protein [Candidatus Woesearchaeota archaeon]
MRIKLALFLFFTIIFSLSVLSQPGAVQSPGQAGSFGGDFSNQNDVQNVINNRGEDQGTVPSGTIIRQNSIEIQIGGEISVHDGLISASELEISDTQIENVIDFEATSDGFRAQEVPRLTQNGITLINAEGVVYKNGILTAEKADSFIKDGSVTTNIQKLNSKIDIFSVEKADSFLSDCLRVDDIEDSEFKVGDKVEVTTKSDVGLKITDCSYNEAEFRGKGKVAVDKGDNPTYTIENGTLTKKEDGYNETVEANNSAVIETDKTFGFRCITINPVGSYFYNDRDLRKDFVINVPKESQVYRLCLRKSRSQQFKEYNGLVDFANKKIELNGIVNYLRYHLKNNQVASLLSDFAYKGLKNVRNLLVYDKDLLFLDNVEISNTLENKEQIAVTKPNNYYNIREMELDDGKVHRVVELNNVDKSQLTQEISYNYESDSLSSKISISGNALVQGNARNSITILPPGHEKIDEALR